MLIIALVLAVIGLAALVFAVVTSNALVAWVCIGASVLGVLLLIVDALAERRRRDGSAAAGAAEPTPESEHAEDADEADEKPDEEDDTPAAADSASVEQAGVDVDDTADTVVGDDQDTPAD